LLFENYGQKVGNQYTVGHPTQKLGDQSAPVSTVIAPMTEVVVVVVVVVVEMSII